MKYIIEIDSEPDEIYRVIQRSKDDVYLKWNGKDNDYPPWLKKVYWMEESEQEMHERYHRNTRREYKNMLEDLKEYHRENLCGYDTEKVNKIIFGKCTGCKNRYTYNMDLLPEFYYFCPLLWMHRFFNAQIYIEKYKLGDDSIVFSIESNIPVEKFHKFIDSFEYMEINGIGISFKSSDTLITQILPFNNIQSYTIPTWILNNRRVASMFYHQIDDFPLYEYIVDDNIVLYDTNLLKYLAPNILTELDKLVQRFHSSASIIQKWFQNLRRN
jgi:hypothetical protein